MDILTLKLRGMSCASCASSIEQAIQSVPGVVDCSVNFGVEQATVKYEPKQTNLEKIQQAVSDAGYSAFSLQEQEMLTGENDAEAGREAEKREYLKLSVGGAISVLLLVGAVPAMMGLRLPSVLSWLLPWVQLVLATPGKGAENGILIKGADSLELAHKIQTIVLDKTGTLTEGKPTVTDFVSVHGTANRNEIKLLGLASAVERNSEHPLATAIIRYAKAQEANLASVQNFAAISGSGVQGIVSDQLVQIGTGRWMEELGIATQPLREQKSSWEAAGKTAVWVAVDGEIQGLIGIADALKPTSVAAVKALQKLGLEVVMLTGDNRQAALAIAKEVWIRHVKAEVRPDQKAAQVQALQQAGGVILLGKVFYNLSLAQTCFVRVSLG